MYWSSANYSTAWARIHGTLSDIQSWSNIINLHHLCTSWLHVQCVVCAPCCGTRTLIRPRTHRIQHCCQTAIVQYIAVCVVQCQLKLMLGAYCVGVRWLLGTTDATQCSEESVALYRISTIYLHFKMREFLMSLKCSKISMIKSHVNSVKSVR